MSNDSTRGPAGRNATVATLATCRDHDHARAYVLAVESGLETLQAVSVGGPCPGCDVCRDELAPDATMDEFYDLWSAGKLITDPFFSWSGCDICGSTLGGDFEPWHYIDSDGEIGHGDRACVDCLLYLANGDLPEQWEGGPK